MSDTTLFRQYEPVHTRLSLVTHEEEHGVGIISLAIKDGSLPFPLIHNCGGKRRKLIIYEW